MRALLFILALLASWPVLAVQPDERLADPVLEERARSLSKGLRCLVCRNESIDDSNADLARDLRLLLRERLVAGDSDAQAVEFIRARYGDYVLLSPPLRPATALLWLAPVLVLAGGGLVVWRRARAGPATRPVPLSEAEKARLAELEG